MIGFDKRKVRSMNQELVDTALQMVVPGKGILAADESNGTINKRFTAVGAVSTEGSRQAYRSLLCTAEKLEEYISGVILYDETMRQTDEDGTPLPQVLALRGILPGIKVDMGAKPLAGFPGETVTEGLDGLRERFAEYAELGARFAKWRAVIRIDGHCPTRHCLHANAHALGRYAALAQEAGLVPIIEPEVLMDGDHGIERCQQVTEAVLIRVFYELMEHGVRYEEMVLKPNMITAGKDCPIQASVDDVAEQTLETFLRVVPAAVPGIVFLSGGQSAVLATAVNELGDNPWELSFSYGRALQQPVLEAWSGEAANVSAAQMALIHRAMCNSAARYGEYSEQMEAQYRIPENMPL
jgi:fructose-bisphosphate aldolase, class I